MNLVTHELGVYPGRFSVDSLYGGMFITLRVFAPIFFKFNGQRADISPDGPRLLVWDARVKDFRTNIKSTSFAMNGFAMILVQQRLNFMPPIINSGPFEDQETLMIRNVLNEFLKVGKEFIKKENMLGHSIVVTRPSFVSTLIGTSTSAWD